MDDIKLLGVWECWSNLNNGLVERWKKGVLLYLPPGQKSHCPAGDSGYPRLRPEHLDYSEVKHLEKIGHPEYEDSGHPEYAERLPSLWAPGPTRGTCFLLKLLRAPRPFGICTINLGFTLISTKASGEGNVYDDMDFPNTLNITTPLNSVTFLRLINRKTSEPL